MTIERPAETIYAHCEHCPDTCAARHRMPCVDCGQHRHTP